MKAADIMTAPVVRVHPETPVTDPIKLMLQDKTSGPPVVDSRGKLGRHDAST
jgi:CBS domain-containing protein